MFDRRGQALHQVEESRVFGGLWDSYARDYTQIYPEDHQLHVEEIPIHVGGWDIARPLLYREKKKGAAHCGRGFGKSNTGCIIATAFGFDNPYAKAKLVSPTYDLADVNREKLLDELPIRKYLHPRHGEQVAKHRLTLIDGFRFQFASAEREKSLRAGDADFVWIDECQEVSRKKRDIVFFQMRKRADYSELLTGTPVAGSDFEELVDEFADDPNSYVINRESRANAFIPTVLFDDAARTMDRRLYEQEVLGLFRALSGVVYWNFDPKQHVRPLPDLRGPARDITREFIAAKADEYQADYLIGVDYPGYAVVLKLIAPDRLWVIDEFIREESASPERLARELKAKGYWPALVVDDASGEHSQHGVLASKTMRLAGFRVVHPKANPNVMDRVYSVLAKFENSEGYQSLFITPKCRQLRKALVSQTFDKGKPDKDCGYFDDILDALGYPIFRWWRPRRPEIPERLAA